MQAFAKLPVQFHSNKFVGNWQTRKRSAHRTPNTCITLVRFTINGSSSHDANKLRTNSNRVIDFKVEVPSGLTRLRWLTFGDAKLTGNTLSPFDRNFNRFCIIPSGYTNRYGKWRTNRAIEMIPTNREIKPRFIINNAKPVDLCWPAP